MNAKKEEKKLSMNIHVHVMGMYMLNGYLVHSIVVNGTLVTQISSNLNAKVVFTTPTVWHGLRIVEIPWVMFTA